MLELRNTTTRKSADMLQLRKMPKVSSMNREQALKKLQDLKEYKIQLKNHKHKEEQLNFNYCYLHVIEEIGEFIMAVKNTDLKNIQEEIADLINCLEYSFLCLEGVKSG